MGKKKKKQHLLTSDFYRSLELLRNGLQITGGNPEHHLFNMARDRELGFDFPTYEDIGDFVRLAESNPEAMAYGHKGTENNLWDHELRVKRCNKDPRWETMYRVHEFCNASLDEFHKWVSAYKFEIEWGLMEELLPTNTKLEEFFGHIETRLPYDNCLYIGKIGSNVRVYLSALELTMDQAIDEYGMETRNIGELESGSRLRKWKPDKGLEINLYQWQSEGVETVAVTTTSLSVNGVFVFNPIRTMLPLGTTIKELSENKHGGWIHIASPLLHPNDDVSWMEKQIGNPDELFRQQFIPLCGIKVLTYASALLDPQLREFAVREDIHGGLNNKFINRIISADKPVPTKPMQRPKFEHRVLTLNMPKDVLNPRGSGNRKDGTRLHSVRGHMMKTAKGKYVWRKAHWRGKEKFGVIKKEYNIPNQQAV